MAGTAKKRHIEVGLFRFPVRMEVAVDRESTGAHTVCTGEDTKHEPTRVKQHVTCPHDGCGVDRTSVFGFPERGIERDGKMVVLTAEQIAEAKGEPVKDLTLGFHPRAEVFAATLAGNSVQNIAPDAGGEKGYTALRDALAARPDLVGVTVWAPSTANALWVVEVVDGRLVASKRAWPENVRDVVAIPDVDVADMDRKMLALAVEGLSTPFDVTQYVDQTKAGLAKLVQDRLGDAVPVAADGAPVAVADMTAALQATLDKLNREKAPAKKAVAKKTATVKKAAAKRTTKKATTTKETTAA